MSVFQILIVLPRCSGADAWEEVHRLMQRAAWTKSFNFLQKSHVCEDYFPKFMVKDLLLLRCIDHLQKEQFEEPWPCTQDALDNGFHADGARTIAYKHTFDELLLKVGSLPTHKGFLNVCKLCVDLCAASCESRRES